MPPIIGPTFEAAAGGGAEGDDDDDDDDDDDAPPPPHVYVPPDTVPAVPPVIVCIDRQALCADVSGKHIVAVPKHIVQPIVGPKLKVRVSPMPVR